MSEIKIKTVNNTKFIPSVILFLLFITNIYAQTSAGANAQFETLKIVDMPSAGILKKYHYDLYFQFINNGGIVTQFVASPFQDFNIGASWGCSNFIGQGPISGQKYPGVYLKYRIFDERISNPAVVIGFQSQGTGNYDKRADRYQTLSPGLFLALSKYFKWALGDITFHGGINYSFENIPEKRQPNGFIGIEQSIGNRGAIDLEYNLNIDDKDNNFISKSGLINLNFRYYLDFGLSVELQLRDLLSHLKSQEQLTRFFCIDFIGKF
ncbi:MAG: hypothetical protein NT007_18205 [Candidatus Kapabacteria bacterium]|nr:hypothetical protein [Candidatus Kapabacteria bacterium]